MSGCQNLGSVAAAHPQQGLGRLPRGVVVPRSRRPPHGHQTRRRQGTDVLCLRCAGRGVFQALPRMRFRFVLQTGHVAFAILVPLSLTRTSPLASRLALHFTQ
jgi:hypothetical protein